MTEGGSLEFICFPTQTDLSGQSMSLDLTRERGHRHARSGLVSWLVAQAWSFYINTAGTSLSISRFSWIA